MEGVLLLGLLGIIGVAYFMSRTKPADYNIDKLALGDTQDKVRTLFGKPGWVMKSSSDGETWEYTIPRRLFVSIEFDDRGILTGKYRSGEP